MERKDAINKLKMLMSVQYSGHAGPGASQMNGGQGRLRSAPKTISAASIHKSPFGVASNDGSLRRP